MTPAGEAFFAKLDMTPPDLEADMQRKSKLAVELQAADPRLPFISAFIIAGDKLSAERSKEWVADGCPAEDAARFVGSFARLDFLVWAVENGHLPESRLLDELPQAWSGSDPDDTDPRFLAYWQKAWRRNGSKTILDGPPLPGRKKVLDVYRGQDPDKPLGISWSLDPKVAERFARGAGTRQHNLNGTVLHSTVERRTVLAYLTGRSESEVILPTLGREWLATGPDVNPSPVCTSCGKALDDAHDLTD